MLGEPLLYTVLIVPSCSGHHAVQELLFEQMDALLGAQYAVPDMALVISEVSKALWGGFVLMVNQVCMNWWRCYLTGHRLYRSLLM